MIQWYVSTSSMQCNAIYFVINVLVTQSISMSSLCPDSASEDCPSKLPRGAGMTPPPVLPFRSPRLKLKSPAVKQCQTMSNSMQAIISTLHTDQCVAAVVAVVAIHVDTRQTVNYDGEDSMHGHCVSQELHVHQNCTNDSFLVENHQARGILWPGRGSESVQTCREKNLKNMQKWTRVCRVLCSSFLLLALYCATQSKRLKIQSTKRSFVHNSYQFITSSAHSSALASGFRPTGEVVVLVAVKGGQRLEGPTPEKSVSMSVSTLFVKEIQIEHVQKYNDHEWSNSLAAWFDNLDLNWFMTQTVWNANVSMVSQAAHPSDIHWLQISVQGKFWCDFSPLHLDLSMSKSTRSFSEQMTC